MDARSVSEKSPNQLEIASGKDSDSSEDANKGDVNLVVDPPCSPQSYRNSPDSSKDLFSKRVSSEPETQEVALHGQVISPRVHKITQLASLFMLLLSLLAFSLAFVFKVTKASVLFGRPVLQTVNVAFASLNIIFLGSLLLVSSYNLLLVHLANLQWTRRKRTIVYVTLSQLVIQFVNSIFFLVPNASSLGVQCSWFDRIEIASGIIRWTCWNSLFCLMAIQAHNISPLLTKSGAIQRGPISASKQNEAMIIMDTSFKIHIPKLVVWCLFEACIVYLVGSHPEDLDYNKTEQPAPAWVPCYARKYECKPGVQYKVFTTLWIGFLFLYVFIIQAYISQTRRRLLLTPYNDYLNVHLMVLRQRAQMYYVTVLGVGMVPILWYTRWERCNNYFVSWLGLLPLQVIATTVTMIQAYYFMAMRPGNNAVQQAWLQEFAWLEKGCGAAMESRATHNPAVREQLMKEPLFCFETAVKLLLWAELVYNYSELEEEVKGSEVPAPAPACGAAWCSCLGKGKGKAPGKLTNRISKGQLDEEKAVTSRVAVTADGEREDLGADVAGQQGLGDTKQRSGSGSVLAEEPVSCEALLQTAMEMYDLEHFEILHEELLETRVLMAWSSRTMVIAFRGTAATANMWSDAKAWRTVHPPARGLWYLGRQPLVHKGFLETWKVNGLDARVLAKAGDVLADAKVSPADFQVLITGHSLGGALATLAAYDIQKAHGPLPGLHVYTYGAPRTGNHAFARDYEACVPHTWHIINDRDAVPRSGKFFMLYKRPGQRALINEYGDLRVRPSLMEVCIHNSGFSIRQHMMASYLRSLSSICVAQCMQYKGLPGGRQGVEGLARSPQLQTYFGTLSVDLEKLVRTPPEQVELPSLAERRKKLKGWCNMGLVDFLSSMLEDLLPPVSQGSTAAALSLLRQDAEAEPERRTAPHMAPGAPHLAQRLASLNLRHSACMQTQRGPSQTSAGGKRPTPGEKETEGPEQ